MALSMTASEVEAEFQSMHSPDMKLYKKRLHSYFHILNYMYAHFKFARSLELQFYVYVHK